MNTSSEPYLTVRQHADTLAHEDHPSLWRKYRNDPLDQLFRAIWLDQFGDETTPCLLLSPGDVKNHKRGFKQPPGRCPIRVLLWRLLPKGDYWVPSAVRAAREDEYLWQEIAALSWDDYDEQWRRRLIEQVVILGSGVKRWKASHWTSKPKSGGRKPGSGALTAQDYILWEKMKGLLVQQEAVSAWDAARHFASEAPGKGSFDSKRRRLANGYNNWISTQ